MSGSLAQLSTGAFKGLSLGGNIFTSTKLARPGFNQSGKSSMIDINSYRVVDYPDKKIHQYEVLIGRGDEKRGLIKKVWASAAVQENIGRFFIFNGVAIGWSTILFKDTLKILVDLDKERRIPAKEGRPPNKHRVEISSTTSVNLHSLESYLKQPIAFDDSYQEALNFLNHLIRANLSNSPSRNVIPIKRSFYFYDNTVSRKALGPGIEARKGLYQSIRPAQGGKLVVNVDVSNMVFWRADVSLLEIAKELTGVRDAGTLAAKTLKQTHLASLRRLRESEIYIKFPNAPHVEQKTSIVNNISEKSATDQSFEWIAQDRNISIKNYFKEKYNLAIEFPDLPLVDVGKGAMYPMEFCYMAKGQRYPYKLDEGQTSSMIRFAVSKPDRRQTDIQDGLGKLNWAHDGFLKDYGVKIQTSMLRTQARVLDQPEVRYGKNNKARVSETGSWNLRGQKFLETDTQTLRCWGVCVISPFRLEYKPKIQAFIESFRITYLGHGGRIDPAPVVHYPPAGPGRNAVQQIYDAIKEKFKSDPQLILFVLPNKGAEMYNQIKRSADCYYGVVSQCVQSEQVLRDNNNQYISNVCMKVNAKLGGTNCRAISIRRRNPSFVPARPMFIGADVSHSAPGSNSPSYAAMTMSTDYLGARYAAVVENNGARVEMITTKNIRKHLKPLVGWWQKSQLGSGRLPSHVFYFRDGVSEGQYKELLAQEVADIKATFRELDPKHSAKFTVIVAGRRHHIRFFPPAIYGKRDRNNNPLPGTLVERDVTHPFGYDFYLCSHAAIQGTSRPTHYHVLLDESKLPVEELQGMIYEHCYQCMRSTTAVSLFPAVYYAHLASNRARSHCSEKAWRGEIPHDEVDEGDLMPMTEEFKTKMWFI